LQRLVRLHRAQFRMQLGLPQGFAGIGHHHIGLAIDDLLEDGDVVRMLEQGRVLVAGLGKALVGTARVDDGARAGLVDHVEVAEFFLVGTADDGRFPIHHDRLGEGCPAGAIEGDRDAAHGHVALGDEVIHQGAPGGLDELRLHPQRLGQRLAEFHVHAFEGLVGAIVGKWLVVAGHADAQLAGLEYLVQA
jgi:hypothetical protein